MDVSKVSLSLSFQVFGYMRWAAHFWWAWLPLSAWFSCQSYLVSNFIVNSYWCTHFFTSVLVFKRNDALYFIRSVFWWMKLNLLFIAVKGKPSKAIVDSLALFGVRFFNHVIKFTWIGVYRLCAYFPLSAWMVLICYFVLFYRCYLSFASIIDFVLVVIMLVVFIYIFFDGWFSLMLGSNLFSLLSSLVLLFILCSHHWY